MSYTFAHDVDLMNICLSFLVIAFKNSHSTSHKSESNGHIKYIGRRKLNKLRNQDFFFSHSVIKDKNHLQLIQTFFQLY